MTGILDTVPCKRNVRHLVSSMDVWSSLLPLSKPWLPELTAENGQGSRVRVREHVVQNVCPSVYKPRSGFSVQQTVRSGKRQYSELGMSGLKGT